MIEGPGADTIRSKEDKMRENEEHLDRCPMYRLGKKCGGDLKKTGETQTYLACLNGPDPNWRRETFECTRCGSVVMRESRWVCIKGPFFLLRNTTRPKVHIRAKLNVGAGLPTPPGSVYGKELLDRAIKERRKDFRLGKVLLTSDYEFPPRGMLGQVQVIRVDDDGEVWAEVEVDRGAVPMLEAEGVQFTLLGEGRTDDSGKVVEYTLRHVLVFNTPDQAGQVPE